LGSELSAVRKPKVLTRKRTGEQVIRLEPRTVKDPLSRRNLEVLSQGRRFPIHIARDSCHQGHDNICILKVGLKAVWKRMRLIAGIVLTKRRR
ncbi:hypothetical protein KCU78_g19, partial [Aureobasidium melanogenum]